MTIDPTLSSLTMSGIFPMFLSPLTPQFMGSLTAALSGSMSIDYEPADGLLLIDSEILPESHAGPFVPGGTAANFAGLYNDVILGTFYIAFRNAVLTAAGTGLYLVDVNGDYFATGTFIAFTDGVANTFVTGLGGGDPGGGDNVDLIEFSTGINNFSVGNVSVVGSELVLQLPIDATVSYTELDITTSFLLQGTIVARAPHVVPEPSSGLLAVIAAVSMGMVWLRRHAQAR